MVVDAAAASIVLGSHSLHTTNRHAVVTVC